MLIFLVLLALGTCLSAASLDLQDHVARHDSPNPPTLPVTLTPAFTIDLNLAPFPPSNANLAPVLNGTISGPLLNGTVVSGLGYGQRFSTYYVTDALNYGFTDDGEEFVIHQSGSGNSTYGQLIKIEIAIGGKYAYLSDSFLLQAWVTNVTAAGGTLHAEIFVLTSTL